MTYYLILDHDKPPVSFTIDATTETELLRDLKTYDLNGPHEVFTMRKPTLIRHLGTFYPDTPERLARPTATPAPPSTAAVWRSRSTPAMT